MQDILAPASPAILKVEGDGGPAAATQRIAVAVMADVGDPIAAIVVYVDAELKNVRHVEPAKPVDVETSFFADAAPVLPR